ncbi:MAG TPA: amidase family protein [Gammaproteobacteria bacterium]|nr:amidase family protein [Gammaproteobacteria bacterium]
MKFTSNDDLTHSSAFISLETIEPYRSGSLDSLTFAVKDLIDVKGMVTGCGNPSWAKSRPPAVTHAICVEQLLGAGATFLGKTHTDELAYSLLGENFFYGTPLNPRAPDRVPGGSSSGSASAVACNQVDFALGTDTGGSVRVPASNCGILGYRPSHGMISVAGVNPLAPTFDTVGVFTIDHQILQRVGNVLTGLPIYKKPINLKIFFLEDILQVCDLEVKTALAPTLAWLKNKFSVETTTLQKITGKKINWKWLYENYFILQSTEIWSTLGDCVENSGAEYGPVIACNFHTLAKTAKKLDIQSAIENREFFAQAINQFLQESILLCFPTTPAFAPLLGTIGTGL